MDIKVRNSMSELREECGVVGVFSPREAYEIGRTVYYGLYSLQHRGQESCGIVVNDDGVFSSHKDLGLVNDVFSTRELEALGQGGMAIGHVRYGTTGKNERANAQPIVVNHIKGSMAVAHNGNIVNSAELRQELELKGSIFQTTSDTEVIAYLITKERLRSNSVEEAINAAMNKLKGAYSLCVMSPNKLIAVRDDRGFRPLCYGLTEDGRYVIASESCALDAVGAKFVRDIEPGEIVIFNHDGIRSIKEHCNQKPKSICIFEYIYFARPDSKIDGISVHRARVEAGRALAIDYPVEADIVIGVPDSGLDAAVGYSKQAGIPYGMGFVKNKYIGRTFIAPGQAQREKLVNIKLNVIEESVRGKRVVMIDDSIVRGTTSRNIVEKLRNAGAKEVHLMLTAPPFVDECYYGTDVSDKSQLIAANHTENEICTLIGCDSIGFLKMDRLHEMIGSEPGKGYCSACFGGEYPAGRAVTGKFKFEIKLSDRKKEEN
ncbi:amidophosphoribosyltransferase [Mogibacterium timidum]|uniref:Amidophosphoribosyltransferase n=2 Tax=Mogibacterium timidum TaxID=35519 RepID=X8J784_9FIRM|nr:amidophosphoribosyltransferase [Mogibacterium timidum]EUC58163.1 amidophosphoribosyltransferase [Mogibacterium timidum ATCC 33093]NWO22580.1 amidophosphoribosyltransferase [Mogibacterium timidum]